MKHTSLQSSGQSWIPTEGDVPWGYKITPKIKFKSRKDGEVPEETKIVDELNRYSPVLYSKYKYNGVWFGSRYGNPSHKYKIEINRKIPKLQLFWYNTQSKLTVNGMLEIAKKRGVGPKELFEIIEPDRTKMHKNLTKSYIYSLIHGTEGYNYNTKTEPIESFLAEDVIDDLSLERKDQLDFKYRYNESPMLEFKDLYKHGPEYYVCYSSYMTKAEQINYIKTTLKDKLNELRTKNHINRTIALLITRQVLDLCDKFRHTTDSEPLDELNKQILKDTNLNLSFHIYNWKKIYNIDLRKVELPGSGTYLYYKMGLWKQLTNYLIVKQDNIIHYKINNPNQYIDLRQIQQLRALTSNDIHIIKGDIVLTYDRTKDHYYYPLRDKIYKTIEPNTIRAEIIYHNEKVEHKITIMHINRFLEDIIIFDDLHYNSTTRGSTRGKVIAEIRI